MYCRTSLIGREASLFGFADLPAPRAGKLPVNRCHRMENLTKTGAGGEKFPAAGNFRRRGTGHVSRSSASIPRKALYRGNQASTQTLIRRLATRHH